MSYKNNHRMDQTCDVLDCEEINIDLVIKMIESSLYRLSLIEERLAIMCKIDCEEINIDLVIKMIERSLYRLSLIEERLAMINKIISIQNKIRKCFTWNRGNKI